MPDSLWKDKRERKTIILNALYLLLIISVCFYIYAKLTSHQYTMEEWCSKRYDGVLSYNFCFNCTENYKYESAVCINDTGSVMLWHYKQGVKQQ